MCLALLFSLIKISGNVEAYYPFNFLLSSLLLIAMQVLWFYHVIVCSNFRTPFSDLRYSIWLDSKLRLQNDPYLILEYFLWRRGYEYAISNHYDRHCVWEEVAQNKKLNKYNHTVIDQQFEFYQSDGLKQFDPSDPNKLLPSCTRLLSKFLSYNLTKTIGNHSTLLVNRCAGGLLHCASSHANVKLIFMSLV